MQKFGGGTYDMGAGFFEPVEEYPLDPRIFIESYGTVGDTKVSTAGGETLLVTKAAWSLDANYGIAIIRLEMIAPAVRVDGILRPKRLWQRIVSAVRYIFKGKIWI